MTLKQQTRSYPRVLKADEEMPVVTAALIDETGNEAFSIAGAVAALSGLSLLEIAALDFSSIQAIVPTADGLTTGTIADGGILTICTVASADAAHIVVLPTPTPGSIVVLLGNATIYELRSSAPATVLISGGTGGAAVESEIPASAVVVAICRNAVAWEGFTIVAGTVAGIEAAA